MDVSGWAPEKIMQLPDHAFGSKYPISCFLSGGPKGVAFDISEISLPERFILWEVRFLQYYTILYTAYTRLAMASYLPTSEDEFMTLQPLLHGYGLNGPEPRKIPFVRGSYFFSVNCRILIPGRGRRLCWMINSPGEVWGPCHVVALISSIPKEVPDWLISGQVKSL